MSPRQRSRQRRNFLRRAKRLDASSLYAVNWMQQHSAAEFRRLRSGRITRWFERLLTNAKKSWNNQ